MRKRRKNYWDMTKGELAVATREFDSELARDDFRPLGPEKQAIWQRLQQQRGKGKERGKEVFALKHHAKRTVTKLGTKSGLNGNY
jgi:hypothetical protein